MADAIVCSQCGAKIRAGRERCPRCRAYVAPQDARAAAEQAAATSRRLRMITTGILGAFVLLLAVLWLVREPAPRVVAVPAHPADLLANRRAATAPEAPVEAGEAAAVGRSNAPPPFLEAAGEGTIAYDMGDLATALERFQAAIEKNPNDAESLSNLGQVLVKLGRTPEAVPYFERATRLVPSRWAYQFNLARAQGLLGNWDQAIAGYRRAEELFPNDYATTFNLALALHKKGDDAGAVDEYKKAVELNPEDASFRLALATSYERLNKRAEAAAAYQEYLKLSPAGPDADKIKARIALLSGGAAEGKS